MFYWVNKASLFLPEIAPFLIELENSYQLWIEISDNFSIACKNNNLKLINKIFVFSQYFEKNIIGKDSYDDDYSALVCCFYEHIPQYKIARQEIKKYWSRDKIFKFHSVFTYIGSERDFLSMLYNNGQNDLLYMKIYEKDKKYLLNELKNYVPGLDEGIMFHLEHYFPEILDDFPSLRKMFDLDHH